jgi:DNA-binding NarL/FixJ family response regulator
VAADQIYSSSSIANIMVINYVHHAEKADYSAFSVLTIREYEVLQLLAEGRSTKEIAGKLNMSVKTMDTHRQQIMDKLNIYSIAGLTKYAIR